MTGLASAPPPVARRRPRVWLGLVAALVASLLLAFPAVSVAQTVLVRVLDGEFSTPVFGALAYLVESGGGTTVKTALTDERGRALFIGIGPGSYRVRVEMIGMATTRTDLLDVAAGSTVTREIRMESSAIELAGIEVSADADRCTVRPREEGLLVAQIWDEARKALSAASFTDERNRYRYEIVRYERSLDRATGEILSEERQRRDRYRSTPFESRPAEDLVGNGFVQEDGEGYLYLAPDAGVLLSEPFLDSHCFGIAASDSSGLIGLAFQPTGERKTVPDIAGTMWLDRETAELRWLEFTYQYLEAERMSPEVGGRVDFRRMPDGTWIVPEWWIRMPVMGMRTDFGGHRLPFIAQYRQAGGLVVDVREAGGRRLGARTGTGGVEGAVLDSLGAPARGVAVAVVGSNQTVFTNARGEFSITGLVEGTYRIRIRDPRLDDAGYMTEPVLQDVIPGEMARLEYHLPSVGEVLFDACREADRDDGPGIVAGRVVDASGRPVPSATVRIRWSQYRVIGTTRLDLADPGPLQERTHGFETTTDEGGSYRFCSVPTNAGLELSAQLGYVASDVEDLRVPEHETGVLRTLRLPHGRHP